MIFTSTPDADGRVSALKSLAGRAIGSTPLYDAVRQAMQLTQQSAKQTNKVVVVFSDGKDTGTIDDAVASAKQASIPLHTRA